MGVVLPAGGSGSRMARAGGPAKQFRPLGGAPVWIQTLRAFLRHPGVGAAVVVVPRGQEAETRAHLADAEFDAEATVATGGPTRQDSVARGVAALPADVDLVLVHDAVRPFVAPDLIGRVIETARASGAAAVAVPVADTLRQGGAGPLFGETVSREGLWAMQTPQAARRDWLVRAHANAGSTVATDEVSLLHAAGYAVRIVEGDTRNVKITRPSDWALAEALWATWDVP